LSAFGAPTAGLGGLTPGAAQPTTPLFGANPTPLGGQGSIFGGQPKPALQPQGSIFGGMQAQQPAPSMFGQPTQQAPPGPGSFGTPMMPQTSPPPNALAAHYAQSYSGAYNPLPMPKRKDSGEFKKLLTSLKE